MYLEGGLLSKPLSLGHGTAVQGPKYANALRFQIVEGRLYLDFAQFRPAHRQLKADEVPYWFPGDVRLPADCMIMVIWLYQ